MKGKLLKIKKLVKHLGNRFHRFYQVRTADYVITISGLGGWRGMVVSIYDGRTQYFENDFTVNLLNNVILELKSLRS